MIDYHVSGQPYCLELTLKGWRITSLRHDCMIGDFTKLQLFTKYYDSLYDLMETISPGYQVLFDEKVAAKLRDLEVTQLSDKFSIKRFRRVVTTSP